MKAFVPAVAETDPTPTPLAQPVRRPTPMPASSKRSPEVNEAILERTVAKLEALSEHFERLLPDMATKREVQLVYQETLKARRLIENHIQTTIDERKALNNRLDAMMTILGDILNRMPIPPAPETEPEH